MKGRNSILKFFFGGLLLFTVLFQAAHGAFHLVESISETHCDHKYADGRNEIGHAHHGLEKCFPCEFTFSNYVLSDKFYHPEINPIAPDKSSAFAATSHFSDCFGNNKFLRGPPSLII